MDEILASIRRIIEPEGESSEPVFTSLAAGDARSPAAEPAAATVEAPTSGRPAAADAEAPLAATRPWGVEANDAQPSAARRDARSPISAGFDRFASALQKLNRRPQRGAVATEAAVPAAEAAVAAPTPAPAPSRPADAAHLREETSLAVAKLRAVADSMGSRSRAASAPAAVPAETPRVEPSAPRSEIGIVEAAGPDFDLAPPVLVAPAPAAFEAEMEEEPEVVAEFITVVPPPAANDSTNWRQDDGFDEAELMLALSDELDRGPAAPAAAPAAIVVLDVAPAAAPNMSELGPLIAAEAGARAAEAFADLATAVRGGAMGAMDEIVRELLKPMLREWLDDNLPHLVERMVQDEIHRAARGSAAA